MWKRSRFILVILFDQEISMYYYEECVTDGMALAKNVSLISIMMPNLVGYAAKTQSSTFFLEMALSGSYQSQNHRDIHHGLRSEPGGQLAMIPQMEQPTDEFDILEYIPVWRSPHEIQ